jgi:hypothetical protein
LKMPAKSPFSVRTRVCNNRGAPSLDHGMCCFWQNRVLTTSFPVLSSVWGLGLLEAWTTPQARGWRRAFRRF